MILFAAGECFNGAIVRRLLRRGVDVVRAQDVGLGVESDLHILDWAWALLTRRTFGLDVLECPKCKGRMKLLALVIDDRSIIRYLRKIGEPTQAPARAPPRGPPYWSSTVLRRKTLDDLDTTTSAVFDN